MPVVEVDQIVAILEKLEGSYGRSPTVAEIAQQAGCSEPTARTALQRAVGEGKIDQRGDKYVSLAIARAFDRQKEVSKK